MSESSTVHSSPIQGSSAPTSIPQESNKMENLAKMTLIETRLSNEKKSVFLAYVLWFFFGSFGVHCFYLGKPMSGLFRIPGFARAYLDNRRMIYERNLLR